MFKITKYSAQYFYKTPYIVHLSNAAKSKNSVYIAVSI
ncbi:hypothetical protein YB51_6010 [Streptococcus suis YB51]|nr:hypothetical protein YB51_6010 [Streptococcus suis YB51]